MQFAHGTTRYTVHFFALCNVQRMGRAILRYMAKTELHVRRLNLHSVNTALLYFQIHSLNTVLLHFEIVWQLSCKEEYFMYQTNACFCRLQVSKNWTVCLSSSALLPSHGWCKLLVKLEGGSLSASHQAAAAAAAQGGRSPFEAGSSGPEITKG